MTQTSQRSAGVGLSIVAVVIVAGAEIARLLILNALRWELGYPEEFAVRGVLFTLVYAAYAGVLLWRGRTLPRRLLAPLLVLPAWLLDVFLLVVDFLGARGSFDLPYDTWWLWTVRLLTAVTGVCLVAAWGVARREGLLWPLGLVVPVVLSLAWPSIVVPVYQVLPREPLVLELFAALVGIAGVVLGCLACWGIELLTRRREPAVEVPA